MELDFLNSGLVTYNLGGKVEVIYNPTDMVFLDSIYETFADLEEKHKEFQERAKKTTDTREIFALARELDTDMRERINGIFGKDVCTPLYGKVSVYASDGEGLPLWASLLLAVFDTMEVSVNEAQEKSRAKIEKYTKKYHR